jgi:undecaprenyl diphosphate synthase
VSGVRLARSSDGQTAAAAEPLVAEPVAPPEVGPRPVHVAIIMDGNRRWARAHGVPELEGHAAGVDRIRWLVEHAIRRQIAVLSLYAFSRENWARSDAEVAGLFSLLDQAIRAETPELVRQGVHVRVSGRLAEVPAEVRDSIVEALAATERGSRLTLNIAFNYAGRTEIVDAVRAIVRAGTPADEIDEAMVTAQLYTAGLPDPDLVIRTGGEQRLSNFLIWQSAYAEFHTCAALWPDFDAEAFDTALEEFARRGRRFGR